MLILILSILVALILIVFPLFIATDYYIAKSVYGRRLTQKEVREWLHSIDSGLILNVLNPDIVSASISGASSWELRFYAIKSFHMFEWPLGRFYYIQSPELKGMVTERWDREAYTLLQQEHLRLLREQQ